MAHVLAAERRVGEAADRKDGAALCKRVEERPRGADLGRARRAIRGRGARVRGYEVPEEHVLREAELGEHAVDDRRGRFRGPVAGELALGGEGNPGDPGDAVRGRL